MKLKLLNVFLTSIKEEAITVCSAALVRNTGSDVKFPVDLLGL